MTKTKTTEGGLEGFDRLVGSWTIEATHPASPGLLVRGAIEVEWLEGKRFLIHRARLDHADFPSSISIIGMMDQDRVGPAPAGDATAAGEPQLRMHYFDSRGVFRVYDVSMNAETWRIWRDAPGFSQRFRGTVRDGGDTIAGLWQMNEDDEHWNDDLEITYRRRK